MLKKPYVSRVFGHLFDLVRLVMRSVSHKTDSTQRISTLVTLLLISIARVTTTADADNRDKKEQMILSALFLFLSNFVCL